MVWLKYDWTEDRVAFWNLNQMNENLLHQIGQKMIISFKPTTIYSQNLITINDTIKNSVWRKIDEI